MTISSSQASFYFFLVIIIIFLILLYNNLKYGYTALEKISLINTSTTTILFISFNNERIYNI